MKSVDLWHLNPDESVRIFMLQLIDTSMADIR